MKSVAVFALLCLAVFALASAKPHKAVGDATECNLCEFAVQYIEGYLKENKTVQEIVSSLEAVCALAPSPYSIQCKNFVDSEVPTIIQYILATESPETACSELGLCSSSAKIAKPTKSLKIKVVGDSTECSLCEFAVQYIDGYLKENKTVQEIVSSLEAVCALAPSPYSAECKQFVDSEVPTIIQYILATESPETACTQLGLCSSSAKANKVMPAKPIIRVKVDAGDCDTCEFVVTYIEGYLKENKTVQEIVSSLEAICALAPSPYSIQCKNFVDSEVPTIIQYILATESPETACSELGLCSSSAKIAKPTKSLKIKVVGDSTECSLCEFAVQYIDGYLKENKTVQEIVSSLEAVCALAPSPYSAECKQFVDSEVPTIIQYILATESPETACTQLGLCSSSAKANKVMPAKPIIRVKVDAGDCDTCEFVVTYIEGYLKENKTVQEIVSSLEAICALAPSPYSIQCKNFVDSEVPTLIKYILTTESPETACTQIGLCSSSAKAIKPLKIHPSKFNPLNGQ